MSSIRRPIALRVETLEDRTLLDGKVSVQLVAGRLLVSGDDQGNGLTLEKRGDATGTLRFLLTPDASTALNDQAPGVPLEFAAADDVRLDLRGGDDALTVVCPSSAPVRSLSIESGSGADFIKLEDCLVTSLAITSTRGDDQVSLLRSTVRNSALIRCADGSCAVSIQDSSVGGTLSVVSTGALSLSAGKVSLSDLSISRSGSATSSSSISLDACTLDGALRISSRGGSQQLSLSNTRARHLYLKHDSLSATASSTTSLDACVLDGQLSVETRGDHALTVTGSSSSSIDHKFRPSLLQSPLQASTVITGGQHGRLSVSGTGTHRLTASSTSFSDVSCTVVSPPAAGSISSSSSSFSDVDVDGSLRLSVHGSHDLSVVRCATTHLYLKLDRLSLSASSSSSISDSAVSGQLSVVSRGSTDVTVSGARAASDFYLKIDGIKGEATRSSLSLSDCPLGDLVVSSSICPLDITAESSSFSRLSTTASSSDLSQRSSLSLDACTVEGSLSVAARTGYDLKLAKGCIVEEMSLRLDKGTATASNSSTEIDASSVTGRLSIVSRGSTDLSLTDASCAAIYLKIDGIKGERLRSSVQASGGGHGGVALFSSCPLDLSVSSTTFSSLSSTVSLSPTVVRTPSSSTLDGVQVLDDFRFSSSGSGHDLTVSSSSFGSVACRFDAPATSSCPVSFTDVDADGAISVVSRGETHVSLDRCAATDLYLKFDRVSGGQLSSSSSLVEVDLHGDLTVSSRGAHDVSLDRCAAASLYLKIEAVLGEARRSQVTLDSTDCDDRLWVQSSTPTDFSGNNLRAFDFYMKIDNVRSPNQGSTVSLLSSTMTGVLALACSSGADSVSLDRVTVLDRATISTGTGNDELTLQQCLLGGQLHGGTGTDALTISDCLFASEPLVFSWEQLSGPLAGIP